MKRLERKLANILNGSNSPSNFIIADSRIVVGILGGRAGTTLDAFQLIHDARQHGARTALFGRKINLSESPLAFIEFLRGVVDGEVTPVEAVKAYHAVLQQTGIMPQRHLQQDLQLTTNKMSYR